MTVKEFYEWAKKKGYENLDFVFANFYGDIELDPDKDLYVNDNCLVFEFRE